MAGVPARAVRPRPVPRTVVAGDCRDAIAAMLPGASRQRCRACYARNLATKVPKSAQPWVAALVRAISRQLDAASDRAQHAQVVTALEAKFRSPRRTG